MRMSNCFFIDNARHFIDVSGKVDKNMYIQNDKSGVHINKEGKIRLVDSLQCAFKEVCFKIKLQSAWETLS